jgi:hypothetical protein
MLSPIRCVDVDLDTNVSLNANVDMSIASRQMRPRIAPGGRDGRALASPPW